MTGTLIGKSIQLICVCLIAFPWSLTVLPAKAQNNPDRSFGPLSAEGVDDILSPAAGGPTIEVWYVDQSNTLSFGQNGNPQPQINILGNVNDADGVATLTYRLNNGSEQDVNFGVFPTVGLAFDQESPARGGMSESNDAEPLGMDGAVDNPRLESPGDFNIEISTSQLNASNTLELNARDEIGNTSVRTITIKYAADSVPSIPYTIDWSQISAITDRAQVIDGQWTLNQQLGTVRSEVGYDRLIGLGDLSWREYEVKVPITIHELPNNNSGGIGIAVRWRGHFLTQKPEEPPGLGWWDLGAYAYYRKRQASEGGPHLLVRTDRREIEDATVVSDYDVDFIQEGKTYYFKVRVEDLPASNIGLYRFKVWEIGQPEPADWRLEIAGDDTANDYRPTSGSVLLVAYNADVSFGTIEIRPLSMPVDYEVGVEANGAGTVRLDSSSGPEFVGGTYQEGTILTLYPTPEDNWRFNGWSGDVLPSQADNDPLALIVDANKTIVAQFSQIFCRLTLTTNPASSGSVTRDPQQDTFACGNNVTLTANSTPGWQFTGWSGDVPIGQESQPTIQLTMDRDKAVIANFEPMYTLTTAREGDGTVIRNPNKDAYMANEEVTLTATAASNWGFANWSGDVPAGQETVASIVVTMDQNRSITALFKRIYSLTTGFTGEGSISRNPDQESFLDGEQVMLTAIPAFGWMFKGWSGDVAGDQREQLSIVVTVDSDKAISATFQKSNSIYLPLISGPN